MAQKLGGEAARLADAQQCHSITAGKLPSCHDVMAVRLSLSTKPLTERQAINRSLSTRTAAAACVEGQLGPKAEITTMQGSM